MNYYYKFDFRFLIILILFFKVIILYINYI